MALTYRVVRVDRLPFVVMGILHPLFFVSDVHAGDRGLSDDHGLRHERAFWWWRHFVVGASGGRLILLGDIFELWQNKRWVLERERHALFDLVEEEHVEYVEGNHDSSMEAPERWTYTEPGNAWPSIVAEHGHRADLWNSDLGIVGRVLTGVAGFLERLGLTWIDDFRWRHTPTPVNSPRRFRGSLYADYAKTVAKETGASLVVLGHTHKPMLADLGETLLANTGCCTRKDFLLSYVELNGQHVTLSTVVEE